MGNSTETVYHSVERVNGLWIMSRRQVKSRRIASDALRIFVEVNAAKRMSPTKSRPK